jgi:exosortase/archaeosortase family protein
MLLPFTTTFNDLLTQAVENSSAYKLIELYITPHIVKVLIVVLKFLGIKARWGQTMLLVYGPGQPLSMGVSWNCLGWQSLVIFGVSLATGFQGNFTRISKLEAITIGLLGTFLLNISRIIFTILLAIYTPPVFRIVFHDYLAAITTIIWLLVFWWFAYSYVLVERKSLNQEAVTKV